MSWQRLGGKETSKRFSHDYKQRPFNDIKFLSSSWGKEFFAVCVRSTIGLEWLPTSTQYHNYLSPTIMQ